VRIAVGGDHAGFPLRGAVARTLADWGHEVCLYGPDKPDPVDFPDLAQLVCGAVTRGEADKAIMLCGTGIGACMAANKIAGIRAALCHDLYSAHQCVEHDDANVLCLGAQIVGELMALELIQTFLGARMSDEEQFRRRVVKLNAMDRLRTEGK